MRREVSTKRVMRAVEAAVADGANRMPVQGGPSPLTMLREAVHGQYLAIRERRIMQQLDKDIGLAGLGESQDQCPSAAETVKALGNSSEK